MYCSIGKCEGNLPITITTKAVVELEFLRESMNIFLVINQNLV